MFASTTGHGDTLLPCLLRNRCVCERLARLSHTHFHAFGQRVAALFLRGLPLGCLRSERGAVSSLGGIGTLAFSLPSPKRGASVCVRETATDFSSCLRAAWGCPVSRGLPRGAWRRSGVCLLPLRGTGTLFCLAFSEIGVCARDSHVSHTHTFTHSGSVLLPCFCGVCLWGA